MRDRLFFPLAAAVAAAFVFVALQPYANRPPSGPVSGGGRNPEDVTVKGRELHRFLPGDYDGIAVVTPLEGGEPILRIERFAEQAYEAPRSGPHIVLAEDLEQTFEQRPVEVVIEARSGADAGASAFEADYYAHPEGESGWKRFPLSSEFQAYTLRFDVPEGQDSLGYDYIGIRPVAPEKRRVMEVKSIRVHAVGPRKIP